MDVTTRSMTKEVPVLSIKDLYEAMSKFDMCLEEIVGREQPKVMKAETLISLNLTVHNSVLKPQCLPDIF